MKRMMNAGAICLGSALITSLAACSANDPTVIAGGPPATTEVAAPAPAHAPRLSLVRAPESTAIAAIKRLSFGPHPSVPSHVLSGGPAGGCGNTSGDITCDACVTGTCCTEDAASAPATPTAAR